MIMYFISSRSQVIFDPENLIIENKRINKFLFGDRIKKKEKKHGVYQLKLRFL